MAKVMLNGKEFCRAMPVPVPTPVPVPETKFGLSLSNFIGEVDANGVLQDRNDKADIVLDGVKIVYKNALRDVFRSHNNFANYTLSAPDLEEVQDYGMSEMFRETGALHSISMPKLKKIGARGFYYAFSSGGSTPLSVDISALETVGDYGLYYAFASRSKLSSIELSHLTTVGASGFYYGLYSTGITDLSLPALTSIGKQGFSSLCYNCKSLTRIAIPALQSAEEESAMSSLCQSCTALREADLSGLRTLGLRGLTNAFDGCTELQSLSLSALETVGQYGLNYLLYRCNALQEVDLSNLATVGSLGMSSCFALEDKNKGPGVLRRVDFPSLTSVQPDSFGSSSSNYAFRYRSLPEGIHFRADMKETIEAVTGYADKWGAVDTEIYFDL